MLPLLSNCRPRSCACSLKKALTEPISYLGVHARLTVDDCLGAVRRPVRGADPFSVPVTLCSGALRSWVWLHMWPTFGDTTRCHVRRCANEDPQHLWRQPAARSPEARPGHRLRMWPPWLSGRCPHEVTMNVRNPPLKWVKAVDFLQVGDFGTAKPRGNIKGRFRASYPAEGAATITNRAGQPPTCVSCIQAGTFAAPQMKSQPTIALGRITGPLSRGRRARPAQSHTTGPGVSARRAPVTHRPEPPLLARSVHDRVRHQAQWRREACSGTRKRTSRPRGR